MADKPGSWASTEDIWCWFMIFKGTHTFPGGEAGSCCSSLCPFSRLTLQAFQLFFLIIFSYWTSTLCKRLKLLLQGMAGTPIERWGWTLNKAVCGQGHKRDIKCVHGVKKSLQTGRIKESFAERATHELGLGEQVWFDSKRRDWQTIACRPNPPSLHGFRNRVVLVFSHAHSLMCPLWLLSCSNSSVLYSPQSLKNYYLDLYRKCLWYWFKVSSFRDLIYGLDV